MLEVADRLIASIGQDTMDTFFWSLTHPSAFRLFFHFSFAVLYMFAHSFIMLLQGKILGLSMAKVRPWTVRRNEIIFQLPP